MSNHLSLGKGHMHDRQNANKVFKISTFDLIKNKSYSFMIILIFFLKWLSAGCKTTVYYRWKSAHNTWICFPDFLWSNIWISFHIKNLICFNKLLRSLLNYDNIPTKIQVYQRINTKINRVPWLFFKVWLNPILKIADYSMGTSNNPIHYSDRWYLQCYMQFPYHLHVLGRQNLIRTMPLRYTKAQC